MVKVINAVVNGDRVECGACGARLADIEGIQENHTTYDDRPYQKKMTIKCKHKANGKTCNEINEILL